MSLIEEVPSAEELLGGDENQLIRLLNTSRVNGTRFDISRVPGVDSLSGPQKEVFSEKLSSAAAKAGPIDTDDLFKRLTEPRDSKQSPSHSHVRSPTSSPPPPESNARYEAFCHRELLRTGGRPAVPLKLLSSGSRDVQLAVAAWLGDEGADLGDGNVPEIISTQLEHWNWFRQRWQWDNRGKAAGEEGFSAYLAWQRDVYLHRGELDMVTDPSFEATMRRIWDHNPTSLEESGHEGSVAYVQAVRKRLAAHHFTQPVRFLEDPRRQDEWTTWVEYLSYIYWSRDQQAAAIKRAEPRYRRAWEKLDSLDWSQSSSTTTVETVYQQLSVLRKTTQNIRHFISETRPYRRAEAACRRQDLRAQWVREQLPLMETKVSETAKGDVSGDAREKRKREDDQDDSEPPPQQKRRKRQDGHSDKAPKLHATAQKGAGAATSGTEVVAPATTSFEPRRSRRLRVGDAKAEGVPPEPKTRTGRTRQKRPQATGTQRNTRSTALT
ncbi:MAG: hypothetical protein Q9216_003821 [Gyalolechia sp. 2 TL-2023]